MSQSFTDLMEEQLSGLTSLDPQVRRRSALAFWSKRDPRSVSAIASFLHRADPEVLVILLRALIQIGPPSRQAMPELLSILSDSSYLTESHPELHLEPVHLAVQVLAGIGDPAVEPLASLARRWDERVRYRAIIALGELKWSTNSPLPMLIRGLTDRSWWVRYASIEGLSKQGAKATDAVQPLTKITHRDRNPVLRSTAEYALSRISEGYRAAPGAITTLLAATRGDDPFAQHVAWHALSWIGPDAALAFPLLLDWLRRIHPIAEPPDDLMTAIAAGGPVIAIQSMMGTSLYPYLPHLVAAIPALGERGREAMPLLRGFLNSDYPLLKFYSIWALHRLGYDEETVTLLLSTLADPAVEVRKQAVNALADIPLSAEDRVIRALFDAAEIENNFDIREDIFASLNALGERVTKKL